MELETTAAIARDLIRFDTTNYGEGRANGETEAAEYLGAKLEELGLQTHYVDAAPGRTSVSAREVGGYSVSFGGQRAYLLQTGEKALVWVKLIARGTAAHGSRVVHDNAVTALAEAVATLGRQDWPVQLIDTTTQLLGEIARIMKV